MKKENNHPKCPDCKSNINVVKNGEIERRRKKAIIDKKQRYLCNNCNMNFYDDTINVKVDKQRQSLMMYLEDMNFSEIGEFLDVNRNTVKRWFKKYGIDKDAIKPLRNSRKKETKQIDEVHTIPKSNNANDNKPHSFIEGFIIIERTNRVYISFLKENQKHNGIKR